MLGLIGSLAGEIAELARSSSSRPAFREGALELFERQVGAEGTMFATLDPTLPIEEGVYRVLDMRCIARARAGWTSLYTPELSPLLERARAAGGIAVDSDIFGRRERGKRRYFADVIDPLRLQHTMWVNLSLRGASLSTMTLGRRSAAQPFRERDRELVRALSPVLALADGIFLLPARAPARELPLPRLTPREREIADLLVLGYTNREIALALGSSVLTVRNQVSGMFRKVGATTRSELTGILCKAARASDLVATPSLTGARRRSSSLAARV